MRRDSAAAFVSFGGAVGVAHGRGANRERSGVERSEKPASQALVALGPAKGREFCGGLPRLSGRSHKRQESRNSRRLAGGVDFLFSRL